MKQISKFTLLLLFTYLAQFSKADVIKVNNATAAGISATILGNATVCLNATKPVVTFTGSGGTAPYTFTYQIDGGKDIIISSTTGNDIVTVDVPTDKAGSYVYKLIRVSDGSGPVDLTEQITVNVNALPTTPIITADGKLEFCEGQSVDLSTNNIQDVTYQWNLNGTPIQKANNSTYTVTKSGSYSLTVKNANQCSSISNSLNITVYSLISPTLVSGSANTTFTTFENKEFFTRCTPTFPSSISISNSTTNTSNINSYVIDWGDGIINNLSSFSTNQIHSYQAGFYNLTFSITTKQGCIYTKTYGVFVGNNPSGGVLNPGNLSGCAPHSITFPITAPAENIPGTKYIIDFGDTQSVTYIHPNVPTSVTHIYSNTSCGSNPIGSVPNSFVVKYTITNPCYPPSVGTVGPIIISTAPTPIYALSSNIICANQTVTVASTSEPGSVIGSSGCVKTPSVYWTITPISGWTTTSNLGSDGGVPNDIDYWTNGDTNLSIKFTQAGNYTLKQRIANGCGIKELEKIITVNELPIISGNLSLCVGFTSQLTGTPTPSITNPWISSNVTVATISNTGLVTAKVGGLTNITYTNSNGCQTTVSFTVNATPTITGILNACIGSNSQLSGSATPAITNAWASSNITVASIDNTGLITAKAVGNSTITYTDTNGCQKSVTFTVNDLPTITGTLATCINTTSQLTGSATAATTTPWSSSNTAVATISSVGLVTAKSEGSTNITYKNSNGCQVIVSFTVNALPIITGTLNACIGSSSQLTGSATAAITNAWVSSNQTVATVDNTGLITAKTVGTSIITYTNLNGCQANATFTVNSLPIISGVLNACVGSSAQLTGSGTAATPIAWISSNTTIATISNTGLVSAKAEGTSNITYTNSNGCQTTVQFTVNALPIITGTLSTCVGTTNQLTGSGIPALTNAWTSSNVTVATISNTGLVTAKVGGLTNITYTNSNGCQTTVSFTVNATPTITGILNACIGSNSQLSGSATPAITNAWASSNITVASIDNTGLITAKAVGNSTITYTDTNGCQKSVTFTVNDLPTITGTLVACVNSTSQLTGSATAATTTPWSSSNTAVSTINSLGLVSAKSEGSTNITYKNSNGCQVIVSFTVNALPIITGTLNACIGSSSQLTGSATSALTNAWVSSNQAVATVDNTGLITAKTVGTSTITYTNLNGCQTNATFTVNSLPTISGVLNACAGSTAKLTGSGTAATPLAWISSNPTTATISNTGFITAKAEGTSNITYTNSNGCQITILFTVNALPIITGTLSTCVGTTSQLTGSGSPATPIAWISSNTTVATISDAGLVTARVGGLTNITYTNSNGCQTMVSFTVNATPTITGILTSCIGDFQQLKGSETADAISPWNSSNTLVATIDMQGNVTPKSTGTTNITYTNSNGCNTTKTFTINPLPSIVTVQDTSICNGSTFSFKPRNGGGNIVPIGTTYSWELPTFSPSGAISGATSMSSQTSLNQTLTNTSNQVATATYTVNTKSGNCPGADFTVTVHVNPTAQVIQTTSETIPNGANTTAINFSTTNTDGTTTYSWLNNNPGIGIPTSGSGDIASFKAMNNTNAPVVATITVTPSYSNGEINCTGSFKTFTITVNPSAQVNQPTSQIVCNGNSTTAVNFATNNTGGTSTYEWVNDTPNIGLAASGSGNITSFTAVNTSNVRVEAKITVTPTYANGGASLSGAFKTFTITVNPTPTVDKPVDQSVCNGFKTTAITFTGNIGTTIYNWTNDKPTIGLAAFGTGEINAFTTVNNGTTAITATIKVTPIIDGCTGTPQSFTITVNPSPAVSFSPTTQTVCSGIPTTMVVLSSTTPGATFTWNAVAPANIDGMILLGTDKIPAQTLINKTSSPIVVKYIAIAKVIGGVSCEGAPYEYSITINPTLNITTAQTQTICNKTAFKITPKDVVPNIVPNGTTYTWSAPVLNPINAITGGTAESTPQPFISQTLINSTDQAATATYTVTPKSGDCGGSAFQVVITVNPSPKVVFSELNQAICSGTENKKVVLSSVTAGKVSFNWVAHIPTGISGTHKLGTDAIGVQTLTNSTGNPLTVIYTATATLDNVEVCDGDSIQYKITVNPVAKVNAISNIKLCNNDQNAAFTFDSNVASTTYKWTNDKPEINLAVSGVGSLPTFKATNTGIVPIIATITVTPTANGCEGIPSSFTITVNPTPTVDKPVNQSVCNGFKTTAITFTGNIGTTIYNWTNDNPTIGLKASGTGDIAEFITQNSGFTAVTATIKVTPTVDGCSGTPQSFTVTVNPSPSVSFSPTSQTVCSGTPTTIVSLSSTTPGATFTWNAVPPANIDGMSTSGTDKIPAQTLINKTSSPIVVKYIATAKVIGGVSCEGAPYEYSITVNPTLNITTAQTQTICNKTAFKITPKDLVPNIVPNGTTYTWSAPVLNPINAIKGGTAESTPQPFISQTLINSTDQAATATYTVTPKSGDCGGSSFQVVVTVNPSPKVVFSKANQVICSGTNSEVVGLTSLTTGNVTFEWTSNAPTGIIGAAASGTNSIPVQTLENTSNLPLDVIYLAKAKLNNGEICEGDNFEYRITVNPVAKVNPVADVKLCDTETSAAINFGSNVLGATFEWTNDLPTIGLATSGSGTLPGFKASNLGITPISAHITVTPKANGCVGTPSVFSITINPTPTVDKPVDQSVCNSFNTTDIKFTGNIATTIYNWKNDNPTIGLGANGTGNIPAFKATNEGATSVKATITLTPSVDGCPGLPKTFTITVNPSPVFTSQPTSSSVCLNGSPTTLSVGYKNGTGTPKYEWYFNSLKSEVGSTLIVTETNSIYTPPASSIGTIYYYCVVTLPSAGCSSLTSDFATVTINSLPTINLQPTSTQSICVGGSITAPLKVSYTGGVGTPIYKWYSNNTPSTTSGTAIPNTNYPEYTPSTFVGVGKFYYYCEVNLSGNGCGSTVSHAAEVVVVPDPVVTQQALSAQTLCQGATADSLIIKMSGGVGDYDYQWYSNGVNSIIGGTLLTGQNIKSYLPSTANVGTMYYYCIVTQPNGPGCNATSEISVVKVNLAPTFVTQPQSSTVCKGETPTLLSVTYKDGVGTPTYQWYINSANDRTSGLAIDKATNATYAPQFSVVGTSYYYCIITLPTGGCSSLLSEVATVVVNQYPVISSFDELIVSGTSFAVNPLNTASDIVPAGTTYTWTAPTVVPANSISGTSASAGAQTSISSQLLTNETKAVGIVSYTVTPRSGDCVGASFKVVVTVNPPISPNVVVTDISCFGANNGIITTNIEGGIPPYKISWFGPNGFTSDKTNISGLEKGNYMLNILDNSSIGFGKSLKIVEPTDIVLQTDFEKDITCNGAANGEIGITVMGGMGGYKYSWTKDNVAYATTEDIDSLSPGEYTVAVTDINNCGPKTLTFTITQPDPLVINLINKTNNLCFGDSLGTINIEVKGGTLSELSAGVFDYKYTWTGGNGFSSKTQNLTHLPAGKFVLTVTDKLGCSLNFSVEITQPDLIELSAITTPIICYGANNATLKLNIKGGVKPFKVEWDNFASGEYQENLSAGDYIITVTDSNSCVKTIKVNIPEAAIFRVTPIVKNVSCFGAKDGSITLNFEGGKKPIAFAWTDNSTSGTTRNNIGPGTYTVNIIDGTPCSIYRSFTITEPQPLRISALVTNALDCDTVNSGGINLQVTGGSTPYVYAWSNGATTEDLLNVPAGNYNVVVTDSNKCTQTVNYTITRPLPISINISTKADYNCTTKYLKDICTASISGGLPPYKLVWSSGTVSGVNGEIMETNQSGIIILDVTDKLGCTARNTFDLLLPTPGIDYQLIDCDTHSYIFKSVLPMGESIDYTYSWNFGDGKTEILQNPQHKFSTPGTYKVSLTMKSKTCTTLFEKYVIVEAPPVLVLDKLPIYCIGDSLLLHVSGAETYLWYNGTVGDSLMIKQLGDYSVKGTSKAGCTSTLNFTATNFKSYNYTLQTDRNEITTENTDLQLWSEGIMYSEYFWNFGDSLLAEGNNQQHIYKIQKGGYYDVRLRVKNPNGCNEYANKRIWITDTSENNTFTPNGDGVDDVFLQGWHTKIYNRNGILLFDGTVTYDGWDGTYKGSPVANDTYFYVEYISTLDGIKTKTGFVTLIR